MHTPTIIIHFQSKNSSRTGNIKQAKREGLYALTLVIVAILVALIMAIVFTGVFIALGRSIQCNTVPAYIIIMVSLL